MAPSPSCRTLNAIRVLTLSLLALVATSLAAQTADDIIARYIARVGGADRIEAATSIRPDVSRSFDTWVAREIPLIDAALVARKLPPIPVLTP